MIKDALRLNLGSRDRKIEGFLNMDIDKHPGVDVIGDVSDLRDFPDGCVEEIYASNILEHFPHTDTLKVLGEWFRVLAKNGVLYVSVPDFERAVNLYRETGLCDWVQNFLMGDQGYKTAFHYAIFDERRLAGLLKKAGFAQVSRVEKMPFGDDCSGMLSNLDGNPVCLNLVAGKL